MNRIKLLRMENGVKQTDLAKYLNVAPNTLSTWETDKNEPSHELTKKLAEYFKTTTDYILGLTDNPFQPTINPPQTIKKPDIKWGDFGISFYEGGNKKLTQKAKNKIAKLVELAVEDEDYWEYELGTKKNGDEK